MSIQRMTPLAPPFHVSGLVETCPRFGPIRIHCPTTEDQCAARDRRGLVSERDSRLDSIRPVTSGWSLQDLSLASIGLTDKETHTLPFIFL